MRALGQEAEAQAEQRRVEIRRQQEVKDKEIKMGENRKSPP